MRWNYTAVILHAIWVWQFVVACLMEFVGLITVMFSGLAEGRPPHPNAILYFELSIPSPSRTNTNFRIRIWYCALSFLLVVTIITEVCLFANERLSPNTFLSLQIGKMVYISVTFGIYAPRYFKYGSWGDLRVVWTYVWQIGVYL
jgi:hypothetical protein